MNILLAFVLFAAPPRRIATPALDPAVVRMHSRITLNLTPTAKLKLDQVARSLASGPATPDPAAAAKRSITTAFAGQQITDRQMNMLTFIALKNAVDSMKAQLDQQSELGETESLRLQMAMDRLSKMMATLSNLLKKIQDTDDGIVRNIK